MPENNEGSNIMAVNTLVGNDTVLHINTGTAAAPVFQAIGFQRGLSHEDTREIIDASHKNSDHSESVYGRRSGTMSLEALEPNPDIGAIATHDALRDAMESKNTILVQRITTTPDGERIEQAEALIGTMSSESPDNDVSTVSVELTLQTPLAVVPPAAP